MNIEEVREFCLTLKNVTESFPFDEVTLVFKVENKMFLAVGLDNVDPHLAVKCDPELAIELREKYAAVEPAWHFNKKYWNAIYLERDIDDKAIVFWIKHSYQQVIAKLPRKIRLQYEDVL